MASGKKCHLKKCKIWHDFAAFYDVTSGLIEVDLLFLPFIWTSVLQLRNNLPLLEAQQYPSNPKVTMIPKCNKDTMTINRVPTKCSNALTKVILFMLTPVVFVPSKLGCCCSWNLWNCFVCGSNSAKKES